MKVYIGADHNGFALKEVIKQEFEVIDLGAETLVLGDDYPRYAAAVAQKVQEDLDNRRGIVICGSGVGVDITANRFQQIRCALGISVKQVQEARNDDDVNMLAIAADYTSKREALRMVKVFLKTPFSQTPDHQRRIRLIEERLSRSDL